MQIIPDLIISVSGNAYQRGHAYGSQARGSVQANAADYFCVWETDLGLTRERVIEFARDLATPIGNYDATILEEMEGLAAGAELSLEEILAINARYELMFAQAFSGQGLGCLHLLNVPLWPLALQPPQTATH